MAVTAGREPAAVDPVARLMVDVPLPHLDHPFDYLVPATLDEAVRAGSRVRVRFAGRLVDAFVLERRAVSEHDGRLAFVERAVGEPVLTPATTRLFRAVADRWAGSFVDVVRLGVPPRHAGAETSASAAAEAVVEPPADDGFARYPAGAGYLEAVGAGRAVRAVWTVRPDDTWTERFADAIQATLAAGRGAIALVPDARDLARLDAVVTARLGRGRHVALSAELGPSARYRRWLAVRRGAVRAVIGTRAAAYAPVADLGLLAIWDDGDDLHVEPRAPYPHARDLLTLRASLERTALLVGGFARTAEAQLLVESGWAHEIVTGRAEVRAAAPRVAAVGADAELARDPGAAAARLPSLALRTAREAFAAHLPVLVQVPRRGYVPSLACVRDRTPARCIYCHGPLASAGERAVPACRWCGRPAGDWRCPTCGSTALRAVVIGARRTAEELGRAFPGVSVVTSGGDRVLADIDSGPALVIATPGAEPVAEGGYGAALLLDGWALLSRPDLRAGEETLRRWLAAAALVRPSGRVVVGADAGARPVQALVRWDPVGFAARELAERVELGFAPAVRMAAATGPPVAVAELLAAADLPPSAETIGPVPVGSAGDERLLVRVPRAAGAELAVALKAAAASRSARKAADAVKLVLDPVELL